MPIPFAQTSVGSVAGGVFVTFPKNKLFFAAQVVLFDAEKGSMVQKLTGHAKKVTSVSLHATKDKLSGWSRFELSFDGSNWCNKNHFCAGVFEQLHDKFDGQNDTMHLTR